MRNYFEFNRNIFIMDSPDRTRDRGLFLPSILHSKSSPNKAYKKSSKNGKDA